ncbi:MAG: carboxypeptidase-like regulatory domain-containing protein [Bacteroidales bacterium]|jgi:hypothetical protein|nr:carboxypeptidase-like regulatory domain-containing protein [Bacteroidales bacterium]
MNIIKIGFFVLFSLGLAACSKDEGKGGLASIKGVVMVQNVNYHNNQLIGSPQPAQDERVFILYGSNTAVGNDTRTSFDGSYEFPFLVQGNYSVFALSDDTLNVKGAQVEIKKDLSLNSRKAKIQADTIIIYRFLEFDEGSSSIRGRAVRTLHDSDEDTTNFIQDFEIFLTLVGSPVVLERARTNANGEFQFSHLIPATYSVYAIDGGKDFETKPIVGDTVEIAANNQHRVLKPFRIYNKK